jgi:molecular chaperone DnaK
MIKDAELNAEEDKKKREIVEAKNSAESQIHSIRKDLEESTVSQDVKDNVEQAIAKVQEAINNEDKEQITQTVSDLYVAAQPLMEAKNNPTDETVVDAKVV